MSLSRSERVAAALDGWIGRDRAELEERSGVKVKVLPPCMPPRLPARVADRHVVGKLRDPLAGISLRFRSSGFRPPRPGSKSERLLQALRAGGLAKFRREGGEVRHLLRFLRENILSGNVP